MNIEELYKRDYNEFSGSFEEYKNFTSEVRFYKIIAIIGGLGILFILFEIFM